MEVCLYGGTALEDTSYSVLYRECAFVFKILTSTSQHVIRVRASSVVASLSSFSSCCWCSFTHIVSQLSVANGFIVRRLTSKDSEAQDSGMLKDRIILLYPQVSTYWQCPKPSYLSSNSLVMAPCSYCIRPKKWVASHVTLIAGRLSHALATLYQIL